MVAILDVGGLAEQLGLVRGGRDDEHPILVADLEKQS